MFVWTSGDDDIIRSWTSLQLRRIHGSLGKKKHGKQHGAGFRDCGMQLLSGLNDQRKAGRGV